MNKFMNDHSMNTFRQQHWWSYWKIYLAEIYRTTWYFNNVHNSHLLVSYLSSTAGPWAEDLSLLWQEGAAQQRAFAASTAKTFFSCMPVLPVICHLALVNAFVRHTTLIHNIPERKSFAKYLSVPALTAEKW